MTASSSGRTATPASSKWCSGARPSSSCATAPARPLGSRADHLHAPVDGRGEPLQRRLPVLDDLAQHPERQETALASFLFEDDLGERHGGQILARVVLEDLHLLARFDPAADLL